MSEIMLQTPTSRLDYLYNWKDWLKGTDTISTYTITATAGITVENDSLVNNDTGVEVWVRGGQLNADYEIKCNVVSVDGREDTRTIIMQIRPE